jgi:hypothetical protein
MSGNMLPGPARRGAVVLFVWLVLSVTAAAAGLVERYPLPIPSLVLVLTAALGLALWRAQSLRTWLLERGPAPLVALHLTRFVGIAFLVLAAGGELPREWALPTGWGDILVAALVVPVLALAAPFRTVKQRRALLAWNVIGVADMLMVIGGAIRMIIVDPGAGAVMVRLPMSLLPTFLVPLILASHALIFAWLWQARSAGQALPVAAPALRRSAIIAMVACAGIVGESRFANVAAQEPPAAVRLGEALPQAVQPRFLPEAQGPSGLTTWASAVPLAAVAESEQQAKRQPSVVGGVVGFVVGAAAGGLVGCAMNRDSYGVFCGGQNDTKVVVSAAIGGIAGPRPARSSSPGGGEHSLADCARRRRAVKHGRPGGPSTRDVGESSSPRVFGAGRTLTWQSRGWSGSGRPGGSRRSPSCRGRAARARRRSPSTLPRCSRG